ncbi:hypothetical protein [Adhaeretor mobilis]|uniref:Heparinase n=1 Tax=Adhaeretor mobilis TaxID=1930276 RepID=A0A517MVX7_9BACT|nr:hypothetical protein [Adhaeretor mobilis]QDS99034.1 hypothetical protein HG15A2_23230 [Adhaeretor mobilis]
MSQTLLPPNNSMFDASEPQDRPGLLASAGKANFWRSSAPKSANKSLEAAGSTWLKYLASRKAVSAHKLARVPLTQSALGWGIKRTQLSKPCQELLAAADHVLAVGKGNSKEKRLRSVAGLVEKWLAGFHELPQNRDSALSVLAVAQLLPHLASMLDGIMWWRALDALYETAQAAANWQIDLDLPPETTLAQQLISGELPLTLALLFPEMKPLHALRNEARTRLTACLDDLLNGEGQCHGTVLSVWRPLLASWTRCAIMGEKFKKSAWSAEAAAQYAWGVTQALRWTRADGTQVFGGPGDAAWDSDFVAAMLDLAGDAADRAAAAESLSNKLYSRKKSVANPAQPESADHCEWAGLAILRCDWSRKSARVGVDFSSDAIRLEVNAGGRQLFSGNWDLAAEADGTALRIEGSWEEACWFSDDECDYLELSCELAGGGTLERQILLARNDGFLLLTDNLIRPRAEQLTHTWSLPLAKGIAFRAENETREGLLVDEKKLLARIIPASLPEWRVDPRVGTLTVEGEGDQDNRLTLRHQQLGNAVCVPMFIDLSPRRVKKPCTWRQLTVAQSLEIVNHDTAAAFRVQCGKDQWVAYRSLTNPANRTFLGQNVSSEFFVARFLSPEGETEELIEIEGR